MRRLIACEGKLSSGALSNLKQIASREFYEGELEAEACGGGDIRLSKSLSFPVALTRLSSMHCNLGYKRGWPHIRGNQVGFRTIWFVRKGELSIARSHGTCVVKAGQVGFIDSNVPFHAKAICDSAGEYDSYQVMVPGPLFLVHLKQADRLGVPVDLAGEQGKVVRDILDLLIRDGENLSQRAALPLTESLLAALSEHLEQKELNITGRDRIIEKRIVDIDNYVMRNLADKDLSLERVARECGISVRYLCYVFKFRNTSYSKFLWENRLGKARDLMCSPNARELSLHEIADLTGFKSAAHFSRIFKSRYGVPPRDYRKSFGKTDTGSRDA